ncbi:MAG: DUF4384 domain-containing protein [Pirellulales bacterium]
MNHNHTSFRRGLFVSLLWAASTVSLAVADEPQPPMPPDTEAPAADAEQAPPANTDQAPAADAQQTQPANTEQAPPAAADQTPRAEPAAPQPQPTDSGPADPKPTDPQPTEPMPTEPMPTEPMPTDPQPTDPKPTDPQPPVTDTDAPAPDAPSQPGQPLVNPQPGFLANVAVDHEDGVYREGEKVGVRFVAERESHVYLIYHQADKTAWLVFPNKGRPNNLLKAKEQVAIPAPGEPYRFRVRAPFGDEALQVLCSTKPIAELDGLDTSAGTAPQVSAELVNTLQARIAKQPAEFGEHRVRLQTHAKNESTQPDRKPARFGLYIGVNRYQDSKSAAEFAEVKQSAEHLAAELAKRGGVPRENTRLLTDEQSTRANIEEAFTQWLPDATRPGDTIFVFYVGHGNQVRSLDRQRADGLESYLTVYDNDPGKVRTTEEYENWVRGRMILETTLARWLQELPGRQIVIMVEACRSGGLALAKGQADRWTFFTQQAARVKGISQLNTIVICACAPDENDRFSKSEITWMPFFLTEAMDQYPAPLTVLKAFEHYQRGVKVRRAQVNEAGQQEPVIVDNMLLPIELMPTAS